MTSVGDFLKKEREAKNLNIQEVAELTKISERYLACIESGDYDQLPPGPYAKGYIAAYARQVCGDETEALKLYAGSRATAAQPAEVAASDDGSIPDVAGGAKPQARRLPTNGNGKAKRLAEMGLGQGLSLVAAVRRVFPDGGNLRHLSTGGAKNRAVLTERALATLQRLVKLAAPLRQIPKAALVKGALLGSSLLAVTAILVLAAFGAYHLFFFDADQPVAPKAAVVASGGGKAESADNSGGSQATGSAPSVRIDETAPAADGKRADTSVTTAAGSGQGAASRKRSATTADGQAAPAQASASAAATASAQPASGRAATETASEGVPLKKRDPDLKPKPDQQAATDGVPAAPAVAATPAVSVAGATAAQAPQLPLVLMKASVCTAIEERMPVGVGERFPWTTPKIYVWSLLSAADPPAKVRHIYYHEDTMVSDVMLTVGSSHWRTWSFHTLSGQLHIGPWRIDIATLDGRVLRRLHFTIE